MIEYNDNNAVVFARDAGPSNNSGKNNNPTPVSITSVTNRSSMIEYNDNNAIELKRDAGPSNSGKNKIILPP